MFSSKHCAAGGLRYTDSSLWLLLQVDYMGYMSVYGGPPGPLPVTSVAAPPLPYTGPAPQAPAHPPSHLPHRKKEALMSELSSFYSDIASLDTNSRDALDEDSSQVHLLLFPHPYPLCCAFFLKTTSFFLGCQYD